MVGVSNSGNASNTEGVVSEGVGRFINLRVLSPLDELVTFDHLPRRDLSGEQDANLGGILSRVGGNLVTELDISEDVESGNIGGVTVVLNVSGGPVLSHDIEMILGLSSRVVVDVIKGGLSLGVIDKGINLGNDGPSVGVVTLSEDSSVGGIVSSPDSSAHGDGSIEVSTLFNASIVEVVKVLDGLDKFHHVDLEVSLAGVESLVSSNVIAREAVVYVIGEEDGNVDLSGLVAAELGEVGAEVEISLGEALLEIGSARVVRSGGLITLLRVHVAEVTAEFSGSGTKLGVLSANIAEINLADVDEAVASEDLVGESVNIVADSIKIGEAVDTEVSVLLAEASKVEGIILRLFVPLLSIVNE